VGQHNKIGGITFGALLVAFSAFCLCEIHIGIFVIMTFRQFLIYIYNCNLCL
jgi:hypothetical protein